jgi:hypothetical protein
MSIAIDMLTIRDLEAYDRGMKVRKALSELQAESQKAQTPAYLRIAHSGQTLFDGFRARWAGSAARSHVIYMADLLNYHQTLHDSQWPRCTRDIRTPDHLQRRGSWKLYAHALQ